MPRLPRLNDLLHGGELVLPAAGVASAAEPLLIAWRAAEAEAARAYEHWRQVRDGDAYTVYRASAGRADAAQNALARAGRV